ncbi:MAG: cytoplasmic protein [Nitrospirae bacterium]|nr:cytoplasmic protein [Nitrospirota bacterium]
MMKEFEQFRASLLFCPRCREAFPVRERLLLILPDGKLFDYMCAYCASSIGSRKETEHKEARIITSP